MEDVFPRDVTVVTDEQNDLCDQMLSTFNSIAEMPLTDWQDAVSVAFEMCELENDDMEKLLDDFIKHLQQLKSACNVQTVED